MKIAGWHRCSLIDFPGKVAATLFTQGCNLRCPFCHNGDLWDLQTPGTVPEGEIFAFLETRKGLLDGVVVSGGEPTLQPDLPDFLRRLRELGFATKLDSNGFRPEVLENLLANRLLNFVALDVKHIPERYAAACGCPVSLDALRRSLRLLRESGLDYELRTTVVPGIHAPEELPALLELVAGAPRLTLQNFDPRSAASHSLRLRKPFPPEVLEGLRDKFSPHVGQFSIR
ncbi:MAG: anaerobic ribonucleoside-triphosphate reductase activating protein [Puniceicoccales bacterium]|jgi:pyruvate formate lyase activating enzyme|nr:anaerobic ribonucleoside-triphosphate reductase activating protein [Puniceicoccales bacterium]